MWGFDHADAFTVNHHPLRKSRWNFESAMPKFVILLGPPGSLKTTTAKSIFSSSKRKPLLLNLDDFVYDDSAYKADRGALRLKGRPAADKKPLQNLFDKHIVRAVNAFRSATREALEAKKDVVVDVAGPDVKWLTALAGIAQKGKYEVHLLYPRVGSLTVLLNRVMCRFGECADGQTPAPNAIVEECAKCVPKSFVALVRAFESSLVRLVVYDSSQDSGPSTQVFEYLPKTNSCKVFDNLKFKCSRA